MEQNLKFLRHHKHNILLSVRLPVILDAFSQLKMLRCSCLAKKSVTKRKQRISIVDSVQLGEQVTWVFRASRSPDFENFDPQHEITLPTAKLELQISPCVCMYIYTHIYIHISFIPKSFFTFFSYFMLMERFRYLPGFRYF